MHQTIPVWHQISHEQKIILIYGAFVRTLNNRIDFVMKHFLLLTFLFLYSSPLAADLASDTKKEIWHLFEYLEKSSCEFNRNGSWYKPDEAVQHIQKKYRYLIKRGLIKSTEQFIERAASRSSISGKPYMVKCDRDEPIETSIWFTEELKGLRKLTQ